MKDAMTIAEILLIAFVCYFWCLGIYVISKYN